MIRQAIKADAESAAKLAAKMWKSQTVNELTAEYTALLSNADAAIFLCCEDDRVVGFAQCQLRRDYVEGTESSPVGYLEGIYVEEDYRNRGYAKSLLHACEQWAKQQGCIEFASDCELENRDSLAFHTHSGFTEANRIICFVKKL